MKVLRKELFRVIREEWNTNFEAFISEKVVAVSGDVYCENLAVEDDQLRQILWTQIDFIINCAAATNFDERYVPVL